MLGHKLTVSELEAVSPDAPVGLEGVCECGRGWGPTTEIDAIRLEHYAHIDQADE